MTNTTFRIYPAWRVVAVRVVARLFGVQIQIRGADAACITDSIQRDIVLKAMLAAAKALEKEGVLDSGKAADAVTDAGVAAFIKIGAATSRSPLSDECIRS